MRPQDIITKKRDGERLAEAEIYSFIEGVTKETWADYQISAMLMAMFLNELDSFEQSILTQAMLQSGDILDFSAVGKPIADKHSTGGVGDKTSLLIAPILATLGVAVPMISGRGLGHTGGTLDKLESITGFNVNLTVSEFKRIVAECGYAMAGQTKDIVPADKKIYALRDATATVSSVPLMVASIMSKKLAEGLDYLVLDVKTGSGAFLKEFEESKRLAAALVETGQACDVNTTVLVTDMNEPLGKYVGNAHEVFECIKLMRGEAEVGMERVAELSSELAIRILVNSGISVDLDSGRKIIEEKMASGEVLEKFRENIVLQGGEPTVCDDPQLLFESGIETFEIKSNAEGFVSRIDAARIGSAVCAIGGGRMQAEDVIDFQVGYAAIAKLGENVKEGDVLGLLYARNQTQFEEAQKLIIESYHITGNPFIPNDLVKCEIS